MSFLILMTGSKAGERYRLVKEKTIIGRHPGCDIVVDSGSVSRQHAAIEMKDGGWWVEDLGSRNGTIVNGETLKEQHRLEAADEIGVCESLFEGLPNMVNLSAITSVLYRVFSSLSTHLLVLIFPSI